MTVVNYKPGPYQDDGAHYTSAEHEEAERIRLAAIQAAKVQAEHDAALAIVADNDPLTQTKD